MQLSKLTLIAALLTSTMGQSATTSISSSASASTPVSPATTTSEQGVFPSIWNKVTSGIAAAPSNIRNATSDVFGNSGESVNYSLTGLILTSGVLLYQQM